MNAIAVYRISRWFYLHHMTIIAKFFRAFIYLIYNCYVPYSADIGVGTTLGYKGMAVVIHSRAVIGANCMIGPRVTIGGKSGHYEVPIIGDNVYIAGGAQVLGPVKIGNNVVIGANAVVVKDVPDNCVAAGVPAKIIKENIIASDLAN